MLCSVLPASAGALTTRRLADSGEKEEQEEEEGVEVLGSLAPTKHVLPSTRSPPNKFR